MVSVDSRSIGYLPSALATATMMRVIDEVEPLNTMEYQKQLLGVLKICKVLSLSLNLDCLFVYKI